MHNRQPLPRQWLMTDPRGGDPVALVRALKARTGIIVRHRELAPTARRKLFRAVKRASGGKHLVLLAASPTVARAWGAAGAHDRSPRRSCGMRTAPVHDCREAAAARRVGADLVFVSPIFATVSHPDAKTLGPRRARAIAGLACAPAIALGGLNGRRFKRIAGFGFYGWAGISAFRT